MFGQQEFDTGKLLNRIILLVFILLLVFGTSNLEDISTV